MLSSLALPPDGSTQANTSMAATDVEEVSSVKKRRFSLRKMFMRSKKLQSDAEEPSSSSTGPREPQEETLTCNVCFVQRPIGVFPVLLTCEHRTCMDCLRQYLTLAIKEWRVMVSCPECSEVFHPSDIREILNDDNLFNKYEEFTLRRALVSIPDVRWCPAPDCVYAVIASGCASCPQLKCNRPGCKTEFCYHCRQIWHPNTTCDSARTRNNIAEIGSLSSSERRGSSNEDMKPCPRCGALFIKMDDGSCNHMTCSVCGSEFCWLCMKEISDLHYLRLVPFKSLFAAYVSFVLMQKPVGLPSFYFVQPSVGWASWPIFSISRLVLLPVAAPVSRRVRRLAFILLRAVFVTRNRFILPGNIVTLEVG